jgi:4-hydroxybenzoate polyprenyltransferase
MTLLLAYARERLTASRLLPAVLLLILATIAGRGWSGGGALVADALTGLALVIAFRIWDDLADLERDRTTHPDRVAVRAASLLPLRIAASVIGIAGATLLGLTRGVPSVAFLASYTIVLAAVYAGRGPRSAASDAILLLKYGVFTLALIGVPDARTARGLAAAAAAFVAACLYEWWHDTESPLFSGKNGPPRVGGRDQPADPRSPIPDPRFGGSR